METMARAHAPRHAGRLQRQAAGGVLRRRGQGDRGPARGDPARSATAAATARSSAATASSGPTSEALELLDQVTRIYWAKCEQDRARRSLARSRGRRSKVDADTAVDVRRKRACARRDGDRVASPAASWSTHPVWSRRLASIRLPAGSRSVRPPGLACSVVGDPVLALNGGADGVHLGDPHRVAAVRVRSAPGGSWALPAACRAMPRWSPARRGRTIVMFGGAGRAARSTLLVELVGWWSELFVLPCAVPSDGAPQSAACWSRPGPTFSS